MRQTTEQSIVLFGRPRGDFGEEKKKGDRLIACAVLPEPGLGGDDLRSGETHKMTTQKTCLDLDLP